MDNFKDYKDYKERSLELARAYIPIQVMHDVFNQREGLCKGTIFPELERPYMKGKNCNPHKRYKEGEY